MTAASDRLTMCIESGLHAGASLKLGDERYVLGSSIEYDVVLRDAQVEPRHVAVQRSDRQLQIEPLTAEVQLVDGGTFGPGAVYPLSLPVSLLVGEARITFSAPKSPSP